jgi:hypothetical protein
MFKIKIARYFLFLIWATFCLAMMCTNPESPQNNNQIFRSASWMGVPLSGRYLELNPDDSSFLLIESEFRIPARSRDTGKTILYWTGTYSIRKKTTDQYTFKTNVDSLAAYDGVSRNPDFYKNDQIVRTIEGILYDSIEIPTRITGQATLGMYYKGSGASSVSTLDLHVTNE